MLKQLIKRIRRDQRGTTAVELALISPVLATVLFGIIELSVAMFVNTVVEGGLRDASRVGLTGMDTGGTSREQRIADIVNEASLGMVNLTPSDISSLIYPSFGDIGQPEPYTDVNGDGSYTANAFTHNGVSYPDGEPTMI
ncbi:TadE/TadG family type IV pilus assembly protein [Sneathiella glossodoripedis]|uniref:TadE/TadG family type IV pilus assembly protein n=1 Tax=Sneathiella glossodoripedis TaxID=418853 RepID=UPI0004712495|nr:TadE/TadG family type IV pilus assembly protein [Sneathiella glossodoripedis]